MIETTLASLVGEQSLSKTRLEEESKWAIVNEVNPPQESYATEEQLEAEPTSFRSERQRVNRAIDKSVGIPNVRGSLKTLDQQWECVVEQVDEETVHCEMHDLTNPENEPEFAQIYLSEFNEYDRSRLIEGAVFYWSIGRERKEHGQIVKFSQLRLRPTPVLTGTLKKQIQDRARNLHGIFRQSEPAGTSCE